MPIPAAPMSSEPEGPVPKVCVMLWVTCGYLIALSVSFLTVKTLVFKNVSLRSVYSVKHGCIFVGLGGWFLVWGCLFRSGRRSECASGSFFWPLGPREEIVVGRLGPRLSSWECSHFLKTNCSFPSPFSWIGDPFLLSPPENA